MKIKIGLIILLTLASTRTYAGNITLQRLGIDSNSTIGHTMAIWMSEYNIKEYFTHTSSYISIIASGDNTASSFVISVVPWANFRIVDDYVGYFEYDGFDVILTDRTNGLLHGVNDNPKDDGKIFKESELLTVSDAPMWIYYFCGEKLDNISTYRVPELMKNNPGTDGIIADRIYHLVDLDKQPEFPGGNKVMKQWIESNIRYPSEAKANGVQGKVQIRFTIRENGELTDFELLLPQRYPELNDEAMRLVKSMPHWIPGQVDGRNINASYILPVLFELE